VGEFSPNLAVWNKQPSLEDAHLRSNPAQARKYLKIIQFLI
jgi:hypothetical protein